MESLEAAAIAEAKVAKGSKIRKHPLRKISERVFALIGLLWLGPGSNRRPSAFQADARTN